MARKKSKKAIDLQAHYAKLLAPLVDEAPWILRVTEWKDKPAPLFIIKQRRSRDSDNGTAERKWVLKDRGLLYGESQRRCLPTIQQILGRVLDEYQQPLELAQYVPKTGLKFRGNLPLDEEAGCKLALMFKLQERVKETDRVELIARRVDRFTEEEAAYWLSRISNFGDDANRWAVSGMKIMLSGHPHDKAIERMLDQLRSRY
jgi:hypothetical protein